MIQFKGELGSFPVTRGSFHGDAPEYRKLTTIRALQMDQPFEVCTLEGVMQGAAGAYLAEGPLGEAYIIDEAVFNATYETYTPPEEPSEEGGE